MRITIAQGAFFPIPPVMGGGIEKVWFSLGKEFARQGHAVTHISRLYRDLSRDEVSEGVCHRRLPGFDAPKSLAHLKLLDLAYSLRVTRALPEADILVTNTFWLPMLVRTRRHGALYVHVARFPKGQMRFYRHAARIQTVSSVIESAIREQEPGIGPKVKVLPNPLSDNLFALSKSDILGRARKKEILYVGRVHPEKGIGLLIEAFRRCIQQGMGDWRLAIVGPWETNLGGGGEAYYRQVRSQSAALGDKVDWAGSVFDADKLRDRLLSAAFFVYPSLAGKGEACPAAPLEAMACGCPPVVSNLQCFDDYLQDGNTGFVFEHRSEDAPDALARKLLNCAGIGPQLKEVARQGLDLVQRYRVPSVARQYLADFCSLVP